MGYRIEKIEEYRVAGATLYYYLIVSPARGWQWVGDLP